MGAPYFDYIVADRMVIPEEQRVHYAETVVYLPDAFQVNDARRRIAESTPARSDVGLAEGAFVFCSFNNSFKITPPVFERWMRLLRDVDGSVLWLLDGGTEVSANLRREAQARGVVDPERLVFARRVRARGPSGAASVWPTFSSTPCHSMRTPRRAMRCGRDCRCVTAPGHHVRGSRRGKPAAGGGTARVDWRIRWTNTKRWRCGWRGTPRFWQPSGTSSPISALRSHYSIPIVFAGISKPRM